MSIMQYKPFVFIEDIHQTILSSILKNYRSNVHSKKINEYAYLVVQKSPYKLEKVYLYCLLNEFTEEIYIGFTRNIKKSLIQRNDIHHLLGSDGEVVLHSLFILHIEKDWINNIGRLKKTIEKALINKRFSVLVKDRTVPRREEIIDELIDKVASKEGQQDYLSNEFDSLIQENYKGKYSNRMEEIEKTIKELEEEKQKSTNKLKNFLGTDFFSQ